MAVSVTTKPILKGGVPRPVMAPGSAAATLAIVSYDVMPDDRQFVIVKDFNPAPGTELSIITNWTEELKQRVPTR